MKQLMPFDFLIKASVVHEIFHIYVFNMLKRCPYGRQIRSLWRYPQPYYTLPDIINCQFCQFAAAIFGPGAFSVNRPTVWNSLPDHLCFPSVHSEQFRRDLNTYLRHTFEALVL